MKDIIDHLLGLCGEYTHLNLLNVTAIMLSVILVTQIVLKRKHK